MDERESRIGWWTSGGAHVALILWAILGGVFFRPQPSMPLRSTEVSTMSGAEFEALAAASRGAGPVTPDATAVSSIADPATDADGGEAPVAASAPDAESAAQELAQPDTSEPEPDLSDFGAQDPVAVATDLPDTSANQTDNADTPVAPPTTDAPVAEAQPARPAQPTADQPAAPVAPRSELALDQSAQPRSRPDGLVEAYRARVAAQEAARQAAADAAQAAEAAARQAAADAAAQAEQERLSAQREAAEEAATQAAEEAAEEAAAEARRQAADEAREEAEQQAARDAEAAERRAEQERREEAERAEAAAREERAAEERRAAEAERAAEERAEAERQAASERAAEEREAEERRAAEARAAEERAAEEREAERRAAAERAAEEERQAAAEREAAEREAAAARAEAERADAERAEAEAAERALEERLRSANEAAGGAEGADPSTTGQADAGNAWQIEGGSGASAAQDPLAAALSGAMGNTDAAPQPDPSVAPMQLLPSPLDLPERGAEAEGLPMGPPLSLTERDGFRLAIRDCWNEGSLSVEASRMTVSVGFSMSPDGRPEPASLRIADYRDGSETAAHQAFDVARRAILICGRAGYPLPAEKYGRWRDVVVDFRPDGIGFE